MRFPKKIEMRQFKNEKIYILIEAIEKIVVHAINYINLQNFRNLEVIGLVRGYYKDETTLIINETFPIREGDEKHVSFTDDDYAFFSKIPLDEKKKEFIIGWYHSHPGFGLFLSPIDIKTHALSFQLSNPNALALIFDPIRFINLKNQLEDSKSNKMLNKIYHQSLGLFRIKNINELKVNDNYIEIDWDILEND